MIATAGTYTQWLSQAQIAEDRLTAEQRGLVQAAFAFRQRCGDDYYSNRLLSHFLLHCDCGLKVAQIARLIGISRPTATGNVAGLVGYQMAMLAIAIASLTIAMTSRNPTGPRRSRKIAFAMK